MENRQAEAGGTGNLDVTFLAQGEQRATEIARQLAAYIGGARRSLDFAVYDFRLSDPLKAIVAGAIHERVAAGVAVRIAYDADKPEPPLVAAGMDPAPPGTGHFVQSLGVPWRRIGGPKLMHQKYIVRDALVGAAGSRESAVGSDERISPAQHGQDEPLGVRTPASRLLTPDSPTAAVWTGSTNLTDDSWNLQENNIVVIASPQLAAEYTRDFADLWRTGDIGTSGSFDNAPIALRYDDMPGTARVFFSPGRGTAIDAVVATRVASAVRRVRVCSMLLNSGTFLNALGDLLRDGRVPVSGIYDRTQMVSVLQQWRDVPHNHWKIDAVREIVAAAGLIGKNSTPYSPNTPHDFMHDKVLVVDDTVITGSYNFSRSAEFNAENILMIEHPALADRYSGYIDHLMAKYAAASRPLMS